MGMIKTVFGRSTTRSRDEAAEMQLQEAIQELKVARQRISEYEQTVMDLQRAAAFAEERHSADKTLIEHLETREKSLLLGLDSLEKKAKAWKVRARSLQTELEFERQKNITSLADLDSAWKSKYDSLDISYNKLKSPSDKAINVNFADFKERAESAEAQVDSWMSRCSNLENILRSFTIREQSLEGQLSDSKSKVSHLEKETEKHMADIRKMRKALSELKRLHNQELKENEAMWKQKYITLEASRRNCADRVVSDLNGHDSEGPAAFPNVVPVRKEDDAAHASQHMETSPETFQEIANNAIAKVDRKVQRSPGERSTVNEDQLPMLYLNDRTSDDAVTEFEDEFDENFGISGNKQLVSISSPQHMKRASEETPVRKRCDTTPLMTVKTLQVMFDEVDVAEEQEVQDLHSGQHKFSIPKPLRKREQDTFSPKHVSAASAQDQLESKGTSPAQSLSRAQSLSSNVRPMWRSERNQDVTGTSTSDSINRKDSPSKLIEICLEESLEDSLVTPSERQYIRDLAACTNLPSQIFQIIAVSKGNLIFQIRKKESFQSMDESQLMSKLQQQMDDDESILRQTSLLKAASSIMLLANPPGSSLSSKRSASAHRKSPGSNSSANARNSRSQISRGLGMRMDRWVATRKVPDKEYVQEDDEFQARVSEAKSKLKAQTKSTVPNLGKYHIWEADHSDDALIAERPQKKHYRSECQGFDEKEPDIQKFNTATRMVYECGKDHINDIWKQREGSEAAEDIQRLSSEPIEKNTVPLRQRSEQLVPWLPESHPESLERRRISNGNSNGHSQEKKSPWMKDCKDSAWKPCISIPKPGLSTNADAAGRPSALGLTEDAKNSCLYLNISPSIVNAYDEGKGRKNNQQQIHENVKASSKKLFKPDEVDNFQNASTVPPFGIDAIK